MKGRHAIPVIRACGSWINVLAAVVLLCGCRPGRLPSNKTQPDPFVEVAGQAGVIFRHDRGSATPVNILQTIGSGCAFLDYDQDGRLDIFLVNGREFSWTAPQAPSRHGLFRNLGGGRFEDVSARAGFTDHLFAVGCAAADYDGDGYPDLVVAGYGGAALYRNNRDGTWTDRAAAAGLRRKGWLTSASLGDVDADGWLDLYLCGYVIFDRYSPQLCSTRGVRGQCPPRYYDGDPGSLFRNNRDGTFTDVTSASGAAAPDGKSLASIFVDYNDDGREDLFVANDGAANCLFRNDGPHGSRKPGAVPRFTNVALEAGVAYNAGGDAEASMAADAADYNGDGLLDLFATSFQGETDALYRGAGGGGFEYVSREAGLSPTLPYLSFGGGFIDYDNDADQDLLIVSGHVQDNIAQVDSQCTYLQPRQLYENVNGIYRSAARGPAFSLPAVGRGAAFGDYDDDGDVDVLVNNNGGPAMLLRNEAPAASQWLRVRLKGPRGNPTAVGARLTVIQGEKRQVREVSAGNSYASSSDSRVHFGLGRLPVETVTVRWPDGTEQQVDAPPSNQELQVTRSR